MERFSKGILTYERRNAQLYFPAGHVCCDLCPLLETYARKQCRRTGEYILDSRATGLYCPLQEEKEETNHETHCKL